MNNTMTPRIASFLAVSLLLASPGLAPYAAAEDVLIKAPVRISVAPVMNTTFKMPEIKTNVATGLDARIGTLATVPQAVSIQNIGATPEAASIVMPENGIAAQPQAAPRGAEGALNVLTAAQKPGIGAEASNVETSGWRWNGLFDRMLHRRGTADAPVAVKGSYANAPSGLALSRKTTAAAKSLPVPAKAASSRGFSRVGVVAAVAALVLALPALAMAAPVVAAGAAAAAPTIAAVSTLTMIHPWATAATSILGVAYGLYRAQKDGTNPLASAMTWGSILGASTFVVLDLAQAAFLGPAALAMKPLPFGLAAAALANSAFSGKFVDPKSTPSERIMGAFPAIAAALGLTAGVAAFATVGAPLALALTGMSITGVASAIYAALYKPGVSKTDPSAMSRGFVLQSLMGGLALALSNPYLSLPLAALAGWGFWNVVSTTAREAWSQFWTYVQGLRGPKA